MSAKTAPRGNRYAAPCRLCNQDVPAGCGVLRGRPGDWHVTHAPARWIGSPVSGSYVGGCPKRTEGRAS